MSSLATAINCRALTSSDPDFVEVSQLVSAAGRLLLHDDVAEQIMHIKTPVLDLAHACVEKRLRLFHEPTWIEHNGYSVHPNDPLNPDAAPNELFRLGYLVYTNGSGHWEIRFLVQLEDILRLDPTVIEIHEHDVVLHRMPKWRPDNERDDLLDLTLQEVAEDVLRIVFLLSAKNAPLVVDPIPDYDRLNRARRKAGKAAVLGCQPVRWDLTRVERRSGSLSIEDRQRVVAHIVRGHPKSRKSGVFWWSPHYRGLALGQIPPHGRDYNVRK